MSKEDPNKENEKQGLKDLLPKEAFLRLYLASLEEGEVKADKSVTQRFSQQVPQEYKESFALSLENAKRELKAQLMLKAEILAADFYDQVAENNDRCTKESKDEAVRLEAEGNVECAKFDEEWLNGCIAIDAGPETEDKKLKYKMTLHESISERAEKIRADVPVAIKEACSKKSDELLNHIREMAEQVKGNMMALGEEFMTAYLEKVEVMVEEFKS